MGKRLRGRCIGCGEKLTSIDDDPNGEHNVTCARCRAEEDHDFDAEPSVEFNRDGSQADEETRHVPTDAQIGSLVRQAMKGRMIFPRRDFGGPERNGTFLDNNKEVAVDLLDVLAKNVTTKKGREISREQLNKLIFLKSQLLPQTINDQGRRKRWQGSDWRDEGEADGSEQCVVVYPESKGITFV